MQCLAVDQSSTESSAPPTAGQLVTSERGVCGGPLAYHYANLMSHTAFRQSLACVSLLYQHRKLLDVMRGAPDKASIITLTVDG
jgi:hypothetical protein